MRKFFVIASLLAILAFLSGCSKEQEVADLEKEVKEAEAQDYLSDSAVVGEEVPGEADSLIEKELAMTPEAAPVEEPPAEEIPDYSSAGGYTVQISAGKNPEYVKYLAEKYIARGYDAFVTQTEVDGATFYRVRIGVFDNIEEARSLGAELSDKFSIDYWIDFNQ
jgi:cell division septation protein DedD